MKIAVTTFLALAMLLPMATATTADDAVEAAKDDKPTATVPFVPVGDVAQISYAIGADLGRNFKARKTELDVEALTQGLKAALSGGKLAMTENEMREAMMKLNTKMMAKQRIEDSKKGKKNSDEGAAFLAANAKKPGVVTLPSGLQYKILNEGDGPSPKARDTVSTHYRGTLIDGTEFDSSYKRGQPATFPVHGVIRGWTEALQLMKVGSKWQLFIPANLAYGSRGAGAAIGPNATLIFEVELLGIE